MGDQGKAWLLAALWLVLMFAAAWLTTDPDALQTESPLTAP
jgi:hypothetical protein